MKVAEIATLPLAKAEERLEALILIAAHIGKKEPDELPEMEALFTRIWHIRGNINGIPYDAFENDSCPDPVSLQPMTRVWKLRRTG